MAALPLAALLLATLPLSPARLCRSEPERLGRLFEALDPSGPAGPAVEAWDAGDCTRACAVLLAHYRDNPRVDLGPPRAGAGRLEEADDALEDTFTFQGVRARVPRLPGGGLDWRYRGPRDDREWEFLFNRHTYLNTLLLAWRRGGDPRYPRAYAELLSDWVLHNPPPDGKPRGRGWRSMEVGRRLSDVWPWAFAGFDGSDEAVAAARLLMLSAVPDHARVLIEHHSSLGNHIPVEMLGLARAALTWPEFREARAWLEFAEATVEREIASQVYPDGAQKELSNHYQLLSLDTFEQFAETIERGGRAPSAEFRRRLEAMWGYTAGVTRPSGRGPLNNDADVEANGERLRLAAQRHGREDWLYVATAGAEGRRPPGPASFHSGWAGHVVMRSGYGPDALWAFFDVGPAGLAHSHFDRLHLSLSALGRELLVDSGRYRYRRDAWRDYFVGPRGHNVVVLDGRRQRRGARVRRAPRGDAVTLAGDYDFARGSVEFLDGAPRERHERAVLRLRDDFVVVVDLVMAFGLHRVEAFWHFAPGCELRVADSGAARVRNGDVTLQLLPLGEPRWSVRRAEGDERPVQGWWSPRYNEKHPAPAAVYRAEVLGPALFAWVLHPARAETGAVRVEVSRLPAPGGVVRVRLEAGGSRYEAAVRMHGDAETRLSDGTPLGADFAVVDLGQSRTSSAAVSTCAVTGNRSTAASRSSR